MGVSGATYDLYESLTMVAAPGQPTGSSKLCLSCHDGTMAIGSVVNLPGQTGSVIGGTMTMTGAGVDAATGKMSPTSTAYIGTDLSDDHPISFIYTASYPSNSEIKDPTLLPPEIKLDKNGQVQCSSCHDPHGSDFPKFAVASLEGGALCLGCHDKRYWATMPSAHSTSVFLWEGAGDNPWDTDLGLVGFEDDTPAMHSCLKLPQLARGRFGQEPLEGRKPVDADAR